MYKEAVISIIIVILIIGLNIITSNYTKETFSELSNELSGLRQEISEENINKEDLQNKVNNISDEWDYRSDILAYYIEHTELEKVEMNFTNLHGEIETEKYTDALSQVDGIISLFEHIEDKYRLSLKNIF